MLKVIGIIICGVSFSLAGFMYGEKYSDRIFMLNKNIYLVSLLKNEILYKHRSVPESIKYCKRDIQGKQEIREKISNNKILMEAYSNFFEYIEIGIESKKEKFCDIWKNACLIYFNNSGLNKKDIVEFIELGEKIGQTNIKVQISIFDAYITKTREEIDLVKGEISQKKRISRLSGAMIGMLFIIIFI